jgi:glycosyltransferase involved in cell wall biosynthesis
MPFVSIVVPARNCERTIGECLTSLLALDYPGDRVEILAVDNASTDGTRQIIERYRVRCLHEPRRGPSAARNRGIQASVGDIVAFTDADCVATPTWLRELAKHFEREEIWGVAGEVAADKPHTPAQRYVAMRRPRLQETVLRLKRPFAGTGNIAFRRETFQTISCFDPMLPSGEDKDFVWRFSGAGLKLAYNPRALVLHRHRDTASKLFVQFVGWGRGLALVHRKHGVPRSVRRELPEVDLLVALRDLVTAGLRYALQGGDKMDLYYPWFDLLRRVGLRAGALYGSVEGVARQREP